MSEARLPWYVESVHRMLVDSARVLPQEDGEIQTYVFYDPAPALAYAKKYCRATNTCGETYQFDCAHFMAHVLKAGQIHIGGSVKCPAGLCVRVEELAAALHEGAGTYANISALTFDDRTAKGDFGFFLNFLSYDHSFLLDGPVANDGKSAPIFAHSNSRCGDVAADPQFLTARFYRIEKYLPYPPG